MNRRFTFIHSYRVASRRGRVVETHAQWYDDPEFPFVPPGVVYELPCEFVPRRPMVVGKCRRVKIFSERVVPKVRRRRSDDDDAVEGATDARVRVRVARDRSVPF